MPLNQKNRLNGVLPFLTTAALLLSVFAPTPLQSSKYTGPVSAAEPLATVVVVTGYPSSDAASDNAATDRQSWRTVQVFTRQGNDVTPPFSVSGTKWRLTWNLEPGTSRDTGFRIHIYRQSRPYALWQIIFPADGTSGKSTFAIEAENGEEFFLKIFAHNLTGWTITVQDDFLTAPRPVVEISHIRYRGERYQRDTASCICYEVIEPDEYVAITNTGPYPQKMGGWTLKNATKGYPTFTFPADFVLDSGQTVIVTTNAVYPNCGAWLEFGTKAPYCARQLWFSFYFGPGDIWDNNISNTAVLYDSQGKEVARKTYIVAGD